MNGSVLDSHKLVLSFNEQELGLSGFIAVHTANKSMPAFGATRLWKYASKDEALADALRLSKFMSYKAALADLPYGGAKAVIYDNQDIMRSAALKKYTEYVDMLGGMFITGADIGISQQDVKMWKSRSKNFVGDIVDPVHYTVIGILSGIKASLAWKYNDTDLSKYSFAIQGLGKIGSGILQLLYEKADKIYVTDISADAIAKVKKKYPLVIPVSSDEIFSQKVTVFVPCAMYGSINEQTIQQLKCHVVAGGANNQLSSDTMGTELLNKDILYAPDFVINAGGLISVVDEYEFGTPSDERLLKRISIIEKRLREIFILSKNNNESTNVVANKIAENVISSYEK